MEEDASYFFLSPQVEISLGHTLGPSWSACAGPAHGSTARLWAECLACLHLHTRVLASKVRELELVMH